MNQPTGGKHFVRGVGAMAGVIVATGIVAAAVVAIALNVRDRKESPPTAEEMRAEKEKLTRQLEDEIKYLPISPGDHPLVVLDKIRYQRQLLGRIRVLADRLGEPTDRLDELLGRLNRLEEAARRQVGGP